MSNTHKGVLVDPYTKTITDVQVGDFKDIQKHLQCSMFCSGGYDEGGDAIYVNDEGLYTETEFRYAPEIYPYPYAGRVLFLGIDAGGNNADSFLDAEDLEDIDAKFMSRDEVAVMGDLH